MHWSRGLFCYGTLAGLRERAAVYDIEDRATRSGTIAADVFCVVFGLLFLWAMFFH